MLAMMTMTMMMVMMMVVMTGTVPLVTSANHTGTQSVEPSISSALVSIEKPQPHLPTSASRQDPPAANFAKQQNSPSTKTSTDRKCALCKEVFETTAALSKHWKQSHPEDLPFLTCEVCSKKFIFPSQLKQHMAVHSGEQPFECKYCDQHFNHKGSMKRHELLHTGGKKFRVTANQHPESTRTFPLGSVRAAEQLSDLSPHAVSSTDFEEGSNLPATTAPTDQKCAFCGEVFRNAAQLRFHWKQFHSNEMRHFVCDVCNKKFHYHSTLVRHMAVHTGERPFECKHCGKCFSKKSNLSAHAETHTDEKKFQCALCGKLFTQKGSCKLHLQRLHGCMSDLETRKSIIRTGLQ